MSTAPQQPEQQQQQQVYQHQEPPQRQPSFIGLPPISPGPEFSSGLAIASADFRFDGLQSRGAHRHVRDQRPAYPPAAAPGPAPVPRQLPSPGSWLDASPDYRSSNQSQHDRSGSISSASAAQSSPTMSNYAVQATSTYRPSQGYAMQSAYVAPHSGQAQQQPQGHPYQQPYQNVAQHGMNGSGLQQQQVQSGFQGGPQSAPASDGNGTPRQQRQSSSQYATNGYGNGNSNGKGSFQQHGGQPSPQYATQSSQSGTPTPASYQQFASRTGAPPGMPSPSLQSNGTFVLPPGWKVEQSQLQKPLSSPRHRPSPSISSLRQQKDNLEIEKETGALSNRSVSPPTLSPTELRRPEHPLESSSRGQSAYQNSYAPPNPPFAHGQGSALGRVSTNSSQGSHALQDERDGRRSSGMFSSIRNRLGGNAQQGLDLTKSTFPADDGVSEISVPTDEQARKGSFFGFRGAGQPGSEGRASYDAEHDRSAFGSAEKKKAFFARPTGLSFGTSSGQDLPQPSRPSTTEGVSGPPPVGFGTSGPKKRFSKLTGMLNRDKPEAQLSQPQGYDSSQIPFGRPSLTGQRAFQASQAGALNQGMYTNQFGGPGSNGNIGGYGRSRSATNESRPSLGDQSRNTSGQGQMYSSPMGGISEDDQRKNTGGNILTNIFNKRPESKAREQQDSQGAGLGQPQGMMNQIHSPPGAGNTGQFPSFLAHSLGMPGQPLIPPQGQYAGLAHQVQQQQFQQQFLSQSPPPGMSHERLNAHLQGGTSPGVSPVTQSSTSPSTTKPSGLGGEARQGVTQGMQPPIQQVYQGNEEPRSPIGSVQVATAVPIRQVERSPNSSHGHYPGQDPPQGDQLVRGRSGSFVNQIEIGAPKRPNLDAHGRNRSTSNLVPQQSTVHIASLQAPVRQPANSLSDGTNSAHSGPQETPSTDTERQHSVGHQSTQDSPSTRRVSQNPSTLSQNASQATPSTSPAPSQEQQAGPPAVHPEHPARSEEDQVNQGHPSSMAPQSSVYRPSRPQFPSAGQAPGQPPQSWGVSERSKTEPSLVSGYPTQNGRSGQGGPPVAQYYMQGRPPQDLRMTAPLQEERSDKEGKFARMLKTSKNFVQEKTQNSSEKPKGEKESRSAKLRGAFAKKPKQAEVPSPAPMNGPPGGPSWGAPPAQGHSVIRPPLQDSAPATTMTSVAPVPVRAPTQQLVTQGLQQMPTKAQQLLGQPPNSMYQAPSDYRPPQPRRSSESKSSQPYQNYQDERQTPGKSTPPLSPDLVRGTPAAQQPPQAPQLSVQGPSASSLSSNQNQYGGPPQQQQQQPQNQPATKPSSHDPMATISNAKNRAHMLQQQLSSQPPAQQNSQEPQYAQVPIPQGYAPVYAGRAVNSPPAMGTPTYAQPFPGMPVMAYQGQPQQWVHPAMVQGMIQGHPGPGMPGQVMSPQGMSPSSIQPHLLQGVHVQYQSPTQPPGISTPVVAIAPYPAPQQQYMPAPQSTPSPVQGQVPSPGAPVHQPVQQNHVLASPATAHGQVHPHHPTAQYQQPLQQSVWQGNSAASVHDQTQGAQTAPQQAPAHSQASEPLDSQQHKPEPNEVARPAPAAAAPVVSRGQQHFSVVPDVDTASPIYSPTSGPSQAHQTASIDSQAAPEPEQDRSRSALAGHSSPQIQGEDQLQPSQAHNDSLLPQRQISGASEVSSMTTDPATSKGSPGVQRVQVIHPAEPVQRVYPVSPERRRGVTLRDEPLPKVDTPVTATPADQDDIYSATPRQSAKTSPVIPQEQNSVEHVIMSDPAGSEAQSKFAGMPNSRAFEPKIEQYTQSPGQQGFVVDIPPVIVVEHPITSPKRSSPSSTSSPAPVLPAKSPLTDDEPPSPTESELKADKSGRQEQDGTGSGSLTTMNGKPVQSSQDIFEEHKRKQLVRDMEEKIALMPEPEMLEPLKKKKDEDAPVMSATSYPGQEWNPYGVEYMDDDE